MPSRSDAPQNGTMFLPWTLDLTTLNAVAMPPSQAAAELECPPNSFDIRGCRGFMIEIQPGNVVGASCVVELQCSISGVFQSMGTAYQMAIAAGTPSANNAWIVTNSWMQWIKVVTIGAATSGSPAKIWFSKRT